VIVRLAVIAIVALSYFIVWELTERHPIMHLSLFRGINFTVGTVAISLGYLVFFGNIVIFSLWLQSDHRLAFGSRQSEAFAVDWRAWLDVLERRTYLLSDRGSKPVRRRPLLGMAISDVSAGCPFHHRSRQRPPHVNVHL
jgi:hypothetical protein